MQKITEIKEIHVSKRKKIVDGREVYVDERSVAFRAVKYVEGLPRFGHFLFDRIFFYIFVAAIMVPIGIISGMMGITINTGGSLFNTMDILISWLILQPLYYFIFEAAMQSTPAKIILGRIVVDEYGNKPGIKQIAIRSISRAIPFEALSCLGATGWHDSLSKTFVIRKKDLKELKMTQKIDNIEEPISPNN